MNTTCLSLLATLLLLMSACTGESPDHDHPKGEMTGGGHDHSGMTATGSDHDHHHGSHTSMEAGEPADHSIYHASGRWLNRNGEEIALRSLQGKVQVVSMLYTNCDYACPRIIADLKRIESALTDQEREQTRFLIVSIDPERDTPDRLTSFADENNLDPHNWTLLNGSSGDILELAALLGVKYQRVSDRDFSHSNIITVLNQAGEIVYRQEQLENQPTRTIQAIRDLVQPSS